MEKEAGTGMLLEEVGMSMQNMLKKINENRTLLERRGPLKDIEQAEIDRYYRVKNTCTSNAVEGNTFNLHETKLWLEDGISVGGKSRIEFLEIDGHGDAFDYMLKTARTRTLDSISDDLLVIIQEMHEIFYKLIEIRYAGVYRDHDIKIINSRFDTPKSRMLLPLMDEFRNSFIEKMAVLHPIVLAAYAHRRVVQIHPFHDGNGRTSRLLMNLILVNQGYQIVNIGRKIRNSYYNALRNADKQTDDENEFVNFILRLQLNAQKRYMRLIGFERP
ncbi:MAG: Fic family protein [Deltaproteobacteria bacterium]|jgi:Fic family protein|nr:Fic family protein [Deltaproteobacteria bacterium]